MKGKKAVHGVNSGNVGPMLLLLGLSTFALMILSLFILRKSHNTVLIPSSMFLQDAEKINASLRTIDNKEEEKLELQEVQNMLRYWETDPRTKTGLYRLPESNRYLIFSSDCGGFNNIRMVFEYVYIIAWLTKRTLVLPPPAGWYLIDFGPFTRMNPSETDSKVTDYHEFFDYQDMLSAVPIISTAEFRVREAKRLSIPDSYLNADISTHSGRTLWREYIRDEKLHPLMDWAPLSKVIFWPSIKAVEDQFGHTSANKPSTIGVPSTFIHHRSIVEYTKEQSEAHVISFPSCKSEDFRYLGQVASIAAFADESLSRSYKRVLRDNVHFVPIVFDIAARIVKFLGPFKYSALHVRRNDLQYKEVFMDASTTLENIKPLLKENEIVYIATDEKDPNFFAPFAKNHLVYQWKDFFTAKGGNVLTNVEIPRKLEGCIEQVVCAMARFFAGTLESTFSSYIFRLRGYYSLKHKNSGINTQIYFHTLSYSGNSQMDRRVTNEKKPPKGTVYITEHPSIWQDIELNQTFWEDPNNILNY